VPEFEFKDISCHGTSLQDISKSPYSKGNKIAGGESELSSNPVTQTPDINFFHFLGTLSI